MKPLFINTLIDVIREQVSGNNHVQIEGLGSFRKVHQKQSQKKYDDGRIVIMPPKDTIEFKPELKQQNDDK